MDRKKVQNWPFSPTHCFYVSPGICRRFWPEVLTQTPKNAAFRPRSYSKAPNHALEKVPTNETPGIISPPTTIHCLFNVLWNEHWEDTDIWLWAWAAESFVRDRRCVSSKTRCLTCVGVGRSDGRHRANHSFHATTEISRILGILAMLIMGINKCVKETQYHNSILKALQEQTSDKVVTQDENRM